ncbi:hypothetical protein [Actinophytocola xinjiangensis]|nr:hypothetical protein [Actinophytocola xinjiangensis]
MSVAFPLAVVGGGQDHLDIAHGGYVGPGTSAGRAPVADAMSYPT